MLDIFDASTWTCLGELSSSDIRFIANRLSEITNDDDQNDLYINRVFFCEFLDDAPDRIRNILHDKFVAKSDLVILRWARKTLKDADFKPKPPSA
ncbi:MAG: hypothetical protein ABL888_16150 [Pirellulaceae bacterium]